MRASLFDQLYNKLDMESLTPAQRTPTVAEASADNGQSQAAPKDIFGMKFTHSLIKHLDMLYSKMIAGEVGELASEPSNNPNQKIIEGATDSIILNEKESFYSPGNSNVTESM
tara:strand:- start:706 stop:1044 length:339 start_codon:yes stop_codon:yes gene_type:complete